MTSASIAAQSAAGKRPWIRSINISTERLAMELTIAAVLTASAAELEHRVVGE